MSCKLEEEELIRNPFTVMCAFTYDTYGIVKVEKYSYNEGEYFVSMSRYLSYIKRNPKMNIVYHSVLNTDKN